MSSDATLFPAEVRKNKFLASARSAASRIFLEIWEADSFDREGGPDNAGNQSIIREVFGAWKEKAEALECNSCFDQTAVESAIQKWSSDVVESISKTMTSIHVDEIIELEEIAQVIISELLKNPAEYLSETGLVFCGFGDKEIFPSALEYKLCGMINDKAVVFEGEKDVIDHETPAAIRAFAQTSMADTFTIGISGDIYAKVMNAVQDELQEFARLILAKHGVEEDNFEDIESEITNSRKTVGRKVFDSASKEHVFPLRKVIASLPIDEMAELAETLINLQSLKEKVTKPTETVGGPVDVAIITKSEGLVWVKRKHFFPPELNSRYIQRSNMLYK